MIEWGEPIRCHRCGVTYPNTRSFVWHEPTCDGEVRCMRCGKSFAGIPTYKEHVPNCVSDGSFGGLRTHMGHVPNYPSGGKHKSHVAAWIEKLKVLLGAKKGKPDARS